MYKYLCAYFVSMSRLYLYNTFKLRGTQIQQVPHLMCDDNKCKDIFVLVVCLLFQIAISVLKRVQKKTLSFVVRYVQYTDFI